MVDALSSSWKFLLTAVAEVEAERFPPLSLLIRLRSFRFLLPNMPLLLVSRESHFEFRFSHEAILAREVSLAELSVPVKLVALAVPLVAGAAYEGATELLAQWLASGRVRFCHKRY